MKRISFLLLCLYCLGSNSKCFSQELTLDDLLKINCKDSACFINYIIPKGFNYAKSTSQSITVRSKEVYTITSDTSLAGPNLITCSWATGSIDILLTTGNKQLQTSIANSIEQSEFVFKDFKEMELKTWWAFYTSVKYPKIAVFISQKDELANGKKITMYLIRLLILP